MKEGILCKKRGVSVKHLLEENIIQVGCCCCVVVVEKELKAREL
jgi:hypothetical protein